MALRCFFADAVNLKGNGEALSMLMGESLNAELMKGRTKANAIKAVRPRN